MTNVIYYRCQPCALLTIYNFGSSVGLLLRPAFLPLPLRESNSSLDMMIFLQRVQEHLIASVQVGRWHSVPGGAGGASHRKCAGMSAAGGTHH